MTLMTFLYVVMTNVFTCSTTSATACRHCGSAVLDGRRDPRGSQDMSWSNALTKALFGWLIFLGIAYGVRTAGHLGVDALVRLAPRPLQRLIGILACLCCLGYAGLFMVASYDWVKTLFVAGIGAEDLDHFGIPPGHRGGGAGRLRPGAAAPEILVNLLRGRQLGLASPDRPPRPQTGRRRGRESKSV